MKKTEYQLEREARWKALGYTLMDEAKPEIGQPVEAIRVYQPRGFGGVILSTRYLGVNMVRETEYGYTDTTNGDRQLAYSEFEGWRIPEAVDAGTDAAEPASTDQGKDT
ncbi:hypothetical protein [Pseudomonas sp.]|uniref:hypothetical protein n=1 Tax=Pseudomonas sp. TaxID=306 RepID=UPI00291339F0|nr:hypothetical protein [Pseudomonas sp.]MDU4254524.1 hypothetical protein [Pseudomonas sp.]